MSEDSDPTEFLSTSASQSLEDRCVVWGGEYNEIKLLNTCPLDNIITVMSLHLQTIFQSIKLTSTSVSPDLQAIIQMIQKRKFNALRYWIAPKLNTTLVDSIYDFLGYEGRVIKLLVDVGYVPIYIRFSFSAGAVAMSRKYHSL